MVKNTATVKEMFDGIAPKYDLLNHLLSFGLDKRWRKILIKKLKKTGKNFRVILDAATGTGDLAILLAQLKPEKIFGIDIAKRMLQIAEEKAKRQKLNDLIEFRECDSENLYCFESGKFDLITCAFGVRNFENLQRGLEEFYRVLKKGGILAVLEFSKNRNPLFDKIFRFYFFKVLPFFGKIVSKHKEAYNYLPNSVENFPAGKDFCKLLIKAGFDCLNVYKMTCGTTYIYLAAKQF